MPTGDNAWALNQLRHARQSYIYTLAGLRLLNSDAVLSLRDRRVVLKPSGFIWDPLPSDQMGQRFEFEANQLVAGYEHDKANYDATLKELYKFTRRNVVTESFEAVKTYAKQVGIIATWRAEPWYEFARIVRNAIAHNFIIRFNAYALTSLPVTWSGKTINLSMDGTEITEGLLDPLVTLELIFAMLEFVETH